MPAPAAVVQNAADPKQVRKGVRFEKRTEAAVEAAYVTVMETEAGRFLFWHLMATCKVFGSVYEENPARMAYNAGRQDVGHELQAVLEPLQGGSLWLLMQAEASARAKRERDAIEAGHKAAEEKAEDE